MRTTLRLLDPAVDYPSLTELLNQIETEPVTVEVLRARDRITAEDLRWRHVIVDEVNQIIGSSLILGRQVGSTDHFYLWVAVDPIWRNQGIGATLYDHALDFVLVRRARILTSSVYEEHPEGLRFAQKRSFIVDRHIFISTLDLHTFDERHFAGLVESIEDSGIRLFSLADAGDTPEMRRQLYEVHRITAQDVPNFDDDFASYEGYCQAVFEAPGFRPEGQILAAFGHEIVGIALLKYYKHTNSIYNMMTGVLPSYRGRKIAQALKLQSILYARMMRADYLYTGNDSENGPMLAINRKLGYQPQPGVFQLVKKIEEIDRRAAEHA
jgi:GNAT superfamily N-acetyltransferase